jgi:hypothetical protein
MKPNVTKTVNMPKSAIRSLHGGLHGGVGAFTIPGTSIVVDYTLSSIGQDAVNFVAGNLIQNLQTSLTGTGTYVPETQATVCAATTQAMGAGADPTDVANACAAAWSAYQQAYAGSLASQAAAAGDVSLTLPDPTQFDPSTYLWIAVIAIVGFIVVPPLIEKWA